MQNWVMLLTSEWSERDSIRGGQCKIRYMLSASERSDRDSILGVEDNAKSGICYWRASGAIETVY